MARTIPLPELSAVRQSPILLRDRQNVAVATANVTQARLRPNPSFELNSESYPLFESRPGPFLNNQELVLRAGQTIETASKRGKRVQVARQELGVSESEVQNTLRQLKAETEATVLQRHSGEGAARAGRRDSEAV